MSNPGLPGNEAVVQVMLTLFDRATRSIAEEIRLELKDEAGFASALDIDLNVLLTPGCSYALESEDLAWINRNFGLNVEDEKFFVFIFAETHHPTRELPYEVHTGRELRLMLAGVKPLAVFSGLYPAERDFWTFPEDVFSPHVASGAMVQRDYIELPSHLVLPPSFKGTRVLLYALVSEEWRIDAYIEMLGAAEISGWSEEFERRQGSLLGYQDWQTNYFLQWSKRRSASPVAGA